MKKASLLVLAVLCFQALVFAQSLAPADRASGVKFLETTRDGVVEATKGLSEAQWKFKAGPDRWSVAEDARAHRTGRGLYFRNYE